MIILKEATGAQIFCGFRGCQKILDWESSVLLEMQTLPHPPISKVICSACWNGLGKANQDDAASRCLAVTIGPKVDRGTA